MTWDNYFSGYTDFKYLGEKGFPRRFKKQACTRRRLIHQQGQKLLNFENSISAVKKVPVVDAKRKDTSVCILPFNQLQ
jgi:hypothetical protein